MTHDHDGMTGGLRQLQRTVVRAHHLAFGAGAALLLLHGCAQALGLKEGVPQKNASADTQGQGGTGSAQNQGGSGAGGMQHGGGSGADPCEAEQCAGSDTDCRHRACEPTCRYVDEAQGTPCSDNGGAVCDGAGQCVECNTAADCVGTTSLCIESRCLEAGLDDGVVCEASEQCTSAHCSDGVCCDQACAGPCESCIGAKTCGTDGDCAPITPGTDPDDECANDTTCFDGGCLAGTIVFVTSSVSTGNLGGLEGADQTCRDHATSACLTGDFKAWLSDDLFGGRSPSSRFTPSLIPYRLVDGTAIAAHYTELVGFAQLDAPITLDERGAVGPPNTSCFGHPGAWSGTYANGTQHASATNKCDNWTSSTGDAHAGRRTLPPVNEHFRWSDDCLWGNGCGALLPIYCFGQ